MGFGVYKVVIIGVGYISACVFILWHDTVLCLMMGSTFLGREYNLMNIWRLRQGLFRLFLNTLSLHLAQPSEISTLTLRRVIGDVLWRFIAQ